MKSDLSKEILKKLYQEKYGVKPEIHPIAGGGSSREYYRLKSPGVSVVGVWNEDVRENSIFLELEEVLRDQGVNVPEIIICDPTGKAFIQQDLGDEILFNILKDKEKRIPLSLMALDSLVKIQNLPESLWREKVGFPPFSKRLIMWDLNYFKYDYLKPAHISFDEDKLENDFDLLTHTILSTNRITGLMYRDFQSRNIMVKDSQLWFIDFQGARKGPLVYDAVSFIWQAKAPFSFEERLYLTEYYAEKLSKMSGIDKQIILTDFQSMLIFRTLQVLGAYGFRGLIEKKSHFLESLPYAAANLSFIRENGWLENYPEIKKVSFQIEKKEKKINTEKKELELKIFSFSYKKGYPEDLSGNGGGFMFDCRAIHNPGRYAEYKELTGRDEEVIKFLENTEEASTFVKNAVEIVIPSISRYIKRGFTSLQVGFGCTGGRHRSVYCAELFSQEILKIFPDLKIHLIHREQEIEELINGEKI